VSARKEIGKPFFEIWVDVCVEYLLNEKVSWDGVEGLAYVYCNYDGSGRRFGMIEAFENCLRHVCEEGVCGV